MREIDGKKVTAHAGYYCMSLCLPVSVWKEKRKKKEKES